MRRSVGFNPAAAEEGSLPAHSREPPLFTAARKKSRRLIVELRQQEAALGSSLADLEAADDRGWIGCRRFGDHVGNFGRRVSTRRYANPQGMAPGALFFCQY